MFQKALNWNARVLAVDSRRTHMAPALLRSDAAEEALMESGETSVLQLQAEYLWRHGATTSEMARLLNVPYGHVEQLRRRVAIQRERVETRARRKQRMEQRHIAAACGVCSVVGPAADISEAARYSGSLDAPEAHHYDPRMSSATLDR